MYELAVWIKTFHMTFSPSHNHGKGVTPVYKPQKSCKFSIISYTYINHLNLINYLKYYQDEYKLAVAIKMFHMFFSPSHNREKGVKLVYNPQQSCKFTYN